MNDTPGNPQQKDTEPCKPSCSYAEAPATLPKSIMKSKPKIDKIVTKIWQRPNHEQTVTIDESSTDDFPVQPPIKTNRNGVPGYH